MDKTVLDPDPQHWFSATKISTAGPIIAGLAVSFPSSLLKSMIYDPPAAHRAATGKNLNCWPFNCWNGCFLSLKSAEIYDLWSSSSSSCCNRHQFQQCCGSRTFWYGSGSRYADSCLWLMDLDPDAAFYVIDLQDANKNLFKKKFFCIYIIFQR